MRQFISSLRKKTESERRQFVTFFAVTATLLVTGVWIIGTVRRIEHSSEIVAGKDTQAASPFHLFGQSVKSSFQEAKSDFPPLSEVMRKEAPVEETILLEPEVPSEEGSLGEQETVSATPETNEVHSEENPYESPKAPVAE